MPWLTEFNSACLLQILRSEISFQKNVIVPIRMREPNLPKFDALLHYWAPTNLFFLFLYFMDKVEPGQHQEHKEEEESGDYTSQQTHARTLKYLTCILGHQYHQHEAKCKSYLVWNEF